MDANCCSTLLCFDADAWWPIMSAMSESPHLDRVLNLRDLYLLVTGSVIGSGIFLVPATVLHLSGGFVGLAFVIWIAGGVLSLLGGLTYGELSARNPQAGGLYVYIRDAFGKLPAFLYGWTLFFVIGSGAIATLSVAFSGYLSEILPLPQAARTPISIVMIVVVTAVNVWGTRHSADLQNWMTAIKVFAIIAMSVVLLGYGRGFSTPYPVWPEKFETSLWQGFGVAMIGVLWAYEGWQFATFNAGEVLEPQQTYPRAFLFGILTLIFLYLLANFGYFAALAPQKAAASQSIAAEALSAVAGKWAGKIISSAILISILSAANSIVLTSSRVFYAMAEDRLFFAKLAEVHPSFHTPAFSIVTGSLWAILLAATGTFEQLLTYVVFAGWIFYALAAAALFIYRRKKIGENAPYRVPGYPFTPLLFVLSGFALVVNTLAARPREGIIGLLIVSTGIPAYFFWRLRKHKDTKTQGIH